MPPDPRYRHTWPRSFAALFFQWTGLASVGCAVVAVLILTIAGWRMHRVDDFNTRAVAVAATVQRVIGDEALIRYDVPRGTFAQRIPARGLGVGDKVTVWAHPDRPTDISRIAERRLYFFGVTQVCAAVFGALALGLGWRAGMTAVRAIQTRQYGALVDVTVTRIEISRLHRHADDPPSRLHWKDPDGTFGASLWQSHAHVSKWSAGDSTTVYRWRGQAWWVDDLGARPQVKTRVPVVK